MGNAVKVNLKGFQELQKSLNNIQSDMDIFIKGLSKELAARLLSKVIRRTPVGQYGDVKRYKRDNKKKGIKAGDIVYTKSGKEKREKFQTISFTTSSGKAVSFKATAKVGGTLRRGWTAGKKQKEFIQGMEVSKKGDVYEIVVKNSVEYASYVEFGHRTRNHKSWVPGRFMLTISEQELEGDIPRIIENKLIKFWGGK